MIVYTGYGHIQQVIYGIWLYDREQSFINSPINKKISRDTTLTWNRNEYDSLNEEKVENGMNFLNKGMSRETFGTRL